MRDIDRRLFSATIKGDCETVNELLRAGADVNCVCDEDFYNVDGAETAFCIPRMAVSLGDTPLMVSAAYCRMAAMQLLLDSGADINYLSDSQTSALLVAAKNNCLECVELLLERGANINQVDDERYSALMIAIDAYVNVRLFSPELLGFEMIELLIAKGIDIGMKNQYGDTALEKARFQDYEIFERMKKVIDEREYRHLCGLFAGHEQPLETLEF